MRLEAAEIGEMNVPTELDPVASPLKFTHAIGDRITRERNSSTNQMEAVIAPEFQERIITVTPRGRSGIYFGFKTAAEWLVALLMLVMWSPLLCILAVLVKTTSEGPAFYSQTRLGLRGRVYKIYKLRTMQHNCEQQSGVIWALKEDPRTTSIGQFLRLTHLDELPQLVNVLRGEMSLIGPRPERPELAARIERQLPEFCLRLQVRPGVTGLAQMRLPADATVYGVRHKLAHDLYYVEHLGLALDVRIAACTVLHFVSEIFAFFCKSLLGSSGRAAEQVAVRITFIDEPDPQIAQE